MRGRPPKPEPRVPVSLYLGAELAAWLDAQALQHRRTRSEMGGIILETARLADKPNRRKKA